MGTIFVARSAKLSDWGYDVGLSKHLYKIGFCEGTAKDAVADGGWAGESDWVLVKKRDGVDGVSEAELVERLAAREKLIDPNLYPKIKGAAGIFKVPPTRVENHLIIAQAMAGDEALKVIKAKHPDFGQYMIDCAFPPAPPSS